MSCIATAMRRRSCSTVQGNGCPIVRQSFPRLKEIASQVSSKKGVVFWMINANFAWTSARTFAEELAEFQDRLPGTDGPRADWW